MGADFGALLDDGDADLGPGGGGELLEANRGGETGRTRPYNHHIIFHGFAFDRFLSHRQLL